MNYLHIIIYNSNMNVAVPTNIPDRRPITPNTAGADEVDDAVVAVEEVVEVDDVDVVVVVLLGVGLVVVPLLSILVRRKETT